MKCKKCNFEGFDLEQYYYLQWNKNWYIVKGYLCLECIQKLDIIKLLEIRISRKDSKLKRKMEHDKKMVEDER